MAVTVWCPDMPAAKQAWTLASFQPPPCRSRYVTRAHPDPVGGGGGRLAQQAVGAARTAGSYAVVRGTNERGCCARKPCALSTRRMRPQPTAWPWACSSARSRPSAVARAVVGKCLPHGHVPGRIDHQQLPAVPPGVVRGRAPRAFRPLQPVRGHSLQGVGGASPGCAKHEPARQLLR